jgi:16S rRNA (adenine1518-N6/adenine1519-N6)-dimethyltransferase
MTDSIEIDWLNTQPPLRQVIAAHGLAANKGLGQHFLLDSNITDKIVRLSGSLAGIHVVEIGPGPGGLTRALLASPALSITAIERDERCITALQPLVAGASGRFRLINDDALKCDVATLIPAPRVIIANLPYNVGTELLIRWLRDYRAIASMSLMFQREVAERIYALPGNKNYGRLAVLSQACCHVEKLFHLPARAFTPPPKVDSTVVHFRPRADGPSPEILARLEKITAAAFGQRRKMLRSSLSAVNGEKLLLATGIDPALRAEQIAVLDFLRLARCALEEG